MVKDCDELIKRLRNLATYAVHTCEEKPFVMSLDDGCALHEAADAIEKLTNPWISVKDGLPEIGEHHCSDDVFVRTAEGGVGFCALVENCFGTRWFECERPSPWGDEGCEVTHWMPLPEPPKEEK